MPPMRGFQHPASDKAITFRPVSAIFLSKNLLSKNLESLAGDAAALIAPGRKAMTAGHEPLTETFERASRLEAARP